MDRSEWVLVPRVPTPEMAHAGACAKIAGGPVSETYTAMLAAAPPPPAEQASGDARELLAAEYEKQGMRHSAEIMRETDYVPAPYEVPALRAIEAALSQRPVESKPKPKCEFCQDTGQLPGDYSSRCWHCSAGKENSNG